MNTRSSVFGVAFFFVSSVCAVAGSAAGGGAQIAPTDNASVSTYKVPDTSVGASARDSAGTSGLPSSGSSSSSGTAPSSTGTSSTDATSSSDAGSSNPGTSSGFGVGPHGASNASAVATEIKNEKVIDTGDKAVETDKVEKATPRDKTFAPGLLGSVSDISAVSSQKAQNSSSNEEDSQSKTKPRASEDKGDSHPKN